MAQADAGFDEPAETTQPPLRGTHRLANRHALPSQGEDTGRARAGAPGSRPAAGSGDVLPVVVPVVFAGAVVAALAVWQLFASTPSGATFAAASVLLLCAVAAEAFPVPIEGVTVGRTSLASVFVVAAAVLCGWTFATLVAGTAMMSVELGRRRALDRVAYNAAVYALAGAAAGGAAAAARGSDLAAIAAATFLAAAAFYLVNIALVAAVVARSTGRPLSPTFGRYVQRTLVPFGVMTCVALTFVLVWDRAPLAALVLAAPLASIVFYERRMHEAFRRLRELDRMKDEFVAVVSHELRTPLASVYGAASTLQRRDLAPATRESLVGIVYRESARLAGLVEQILWASRLESERDELESVPVDALELAEEVVATARASLPENLSLELVAPPETPRVAADPERIRQILVNLVENAVKYSPDGGRIEVRLVEAGDRVRISVRDEGLGIPAAEQARIFEKFHRLDPHQTRGVGGTGLGLYICRELVERMGGRIRVTSEPGRGSTFEFDLPRA